LGLGRCSADPSCLFERYAKLIAGPPFDPTPPTRRAGSEGKLEVVRYFVGFRKGDAGSDVGQIDKFATKARPICNDLHILQHVGAPNGSTFVHVRPEAVDLQKGDFPNRL
jgi:hypothetical protein